MNDVFVVSAVRTPVGKAPSGTLRHVRPDDLAAIVIREAVGKVGGLSTSEIDDIILGCAIPEYTQGYNVARAAALRAGLPDSVPGLTVNRLCTSGLEAVALGAARIKAGEVDVIVAGGTESMSQVPMFGFRNPASPALVDSHPDFYLPMGLTAENVATEFNISRDAQDAFAAESHRKAAAASDRGDFADELVPVATTDITVELDGRRREVVRRLQCDETIRRDTSVAKLAVLKPAFKANGTVTAGNSSPLSDGAAALVLMSARRVQELGVTPLARFCGYAVSGVPPRIMGIGPVTSIARVIGRTGLKKDDVSLIELNEAFAAQALAVIREAELDPGKVNVNGGAIALGHPLGASGAKLTVSLVHQLRQRTGRFGLVALCVGGGMGGAAVFESIH